MIKLKVPHWSLVLTLFCSIIILFSIIPASFSQTPQLLDPLTIPKFINQLDQPPFVFTPMNVTDNTGTLIRQEYIVDVSAFTQQILPTVTADSKPTGFGPTPVWGYEGQAQNAITGESLGFVASTPGSTFETIQGVPVQVKWVNNLINSNGDPLSYFFAVDPTLHWANPNNMPMDMTQTNPKDYPPGYSEAQTPVPIVTHLHGGEVPSSSDGNPDAWWTPDGKHGPAYSTVTSTAANSAVYLYPNAQQPTTLWYHDHALGLTRLNVLSGLAGFYLIRNTNDPVEKLLPKGEYEVPLAIQDRSFLTDGSLYYPTEGSNPTIHPYWQQAFLGNTIIVNGKAWPNMNVKQGQYRFRILDGSNARFYQISFSNGMAFDQIGTDGGYLESPVRMTSKIIAPAERIDILVDFSNLPVGEKITLENFAGTSDNAQPTGQIMQFTVTDQNGFTPNTLPANLNPTLTGDFPTLSSPDKKRILTLIDVADSTGSLMLLLDGQKWASEISETPVLGSTEDWVFVNPTMQTHPIHVHLVQFQIVQRRTFDIASYMNKWTSLNGDPPLNHATINVESLDPYFTNAPTGPTASEQGWKDTVAVNPGETVTVRLRFTEQNGNPFPFDAAEGPGYVWHCHLLEHEDNEMMRPFIVIAPSQNGLTYGIVIAIVIVVALIILVTLIRYRGSIKGENHK